MNTSRRELLKSVPLLGAPAIASGNADTPVQSTKETVLVVRQTTAPQLLARNQVCAKVDQRLLSKAARMFSGKESSVRCEVVQNARRAGAKTLRVTNTLQPDDTWLVVVEDDGHGVQDFGQLLSLGFSGWSDETEAAEDPAGAGFFSLAPRTVTAASRGRQITITEAGWLGAPVDVVPSEFEGQGLRLTFLSKQGWLLPTQRRSYGPDSGVEAYTVYGGLQLICDTIEVPAKSFLYAELPYTEIAELGVRIQAVSESQPDRHDRWDGFNLYQRDGILLNFFGQRVKIEALDSLSRRTGAHLLVDMTGGPSLLRLKLPDRSSVLENDALTQLVQACRRELYLYTQRQESHRLPYKEYRQALAMGVTLPESEKVWDLGAAIWPGDGDNLELDFDEDRAPLRLAVEDNQAMSLDALAAFSAEFPWCPVTVGAEYRPYSWAKSLPVVREMHCRSRPWAGWTLGLPGKAFSGFGCGEIRVVEKLQIKLVIDKNGQLETQVYDADFWAKSEESVLVTLSWLRSGEAYEILWTLLGGWWSESDTPYELAREEFDRDYDHFMALLQGPCEPARLKLQAAADELLRKVTESGTKGVVAIDTVTGNVEIVTEDDQRITVDAPADNA